MRQTDKSTDKNTNKHAEPVQRFKSFRAFYPFYLGEHANATCRRLHFLGSTIVL